jgi:hypothetical protein
MIRTKAKPDTRKYAADYIRRGMSPVPVVAGKKYPNFEKWQDFRLTEKGVADVFDGTPRNIGILLGTPSEGTVDVDLDVPEATKIAGWFLPPTVMSGRGNAPRSHRWYESPGSKTKKWKDVGNEMILELRSTGCQTLVEPSVHPSGDRYVWDRGTGTKMTNVSPEDLVKRCTELATATIIARNLPPIGGRHDYALALAGYLLRGDRLDEETVLKILLAGWHASGGDSKDAVRDLKGIVEDTAQRLEAGESVVGGPKLEEMVPGLVKVLEKWWGWDRGQTYETVPDPTPSREEAVWPRLSKKVYCGLPGDIVKVIEPESEADPVALLINQMVAYGNAIGRGAYLRVGSDIHYPKIFAALVGETSKGRKGTSWTPTKNLMIQADPDWAEACIANGLSSGEGLIHALHESAKNAPVTTNYVWDTEKSNLAITDGGPENSRLLINESELASPFKVMKREGNTLSPVMREAWDNGPLQTLTKNNPMKVTGSHVSIIGHITKAELTRHLTETDMANGLANRFVFVMVKRSKLLPFGGDFSDEKLSPLTKRLAKAIKFGKTAGEIRWSEGARELWIEVYGELSEGKPGLSGAVTGRAEAQVVRLAVLYAVMNLSKTIEKEHLEAALALWEYADESAQYIFGNAAGDPVADALSAELKKAGSKGLTRTKIRDLFKHNRSKESIDRALLLLESTGQARKETKPTGGRPVERWFWV